MTLKQASAPQEAYVGQKLELLTIGTCVGFCDVEDRMSFVIVPIGTKFLMDGITAKFVEISNDSDGNTVGALEINGGGSFDLSKIKLTAPLVITSIPGKVSPVGPESTDETDDAHTKVSHLKHLAENVDPIACE
jgi:hypothetical protein